MARKTAKRQMIAAEFARRAKQFHPDENPMEISLWGLFDWSGIKDYIKNGDIIPNPGYTKENRTIWCKPSQKFFDEDIAPLMEKTVEELLKLAGWDV
jgi:hypothetical protein